MTQLAPGKKVLGRYEIEEFLGEGSVAQVYRARHLGLGYTVALKILSSTATGEAAARFERAARLMARIRHPNVVSILDYGIEGTLPCVALEFIMGDRLRDNLDKTGPLAWTKALGLYVSVLDGLDAVHQSRVLHRNLKPDNIIVTDEPGSLKIIDLDLAKSVGKQRRRITIAGSVVGTPSYMSPEQLLDNVADARSDIYAAALVFYEVLTGRLPFESRLIERCRTRPPPPEAPEGHPPIPPEFINVIMASLEIDPDDRPRTTRELANRLRRLRGQGRRTTPGARPIGVGPEAASMDERTPSDGFRMEPRSPTDPKLTALPRRGKQALLAASIPPSALLEPGIRDYLATVQGPRGDSFVVGDHFWVALLVADDDQQMATRADSIGEAIRKRVEGPINFEWSRVDDQFTISPASFVGAAPPPVEILEILGKVARS